MMRFRTLVLGAALLSLALPVLAAETAVNLSIFPPIATAKEEDSVTAFRFNLIYGKNASVRVVDLGLVNQTTTGLSKGLGWGFVNLSDADFTGIQLGGVNVVGGNFEGFEWGFVNYTKNARGLQLGFVNYTETLYGVQIGLVNIIKKPGFMPVFPFVNWSF
jgi:uncharacterized protein YjbI with pentapeptide repeats